ncbi:MAG: hypothetical protein HKN81_08030, partial [Gammaproteobacteria bacterium]|nr:hypothetical protein [Gammaproteobacteria bacterium]
ELGSAGDEFTDGQMVFLDFGFAPTNRIDGQFTLNVLGNVADLEPLEIQYGRRGLPTFERVDVVFPEFGVEPVEVTQQFNDRERVEIYDFNATYRGKVGDIEAFYHTPRYHWKYKGDFFGLIREATDIDGQDIWNAKAPRGVEFAGKGALEGLTVLGGPEVFWGANPQITLKYSNQIGNTDWTVMLSEEIDRQGESAAGGTAATIRETNQLTFYTKTSFTNDLSLELGGILAARDREGEQYDRIDAADNIVIDTIDWNDTLGFRAKLNFPLFGTLAYVATDQRGLVAEGGSVLKEFGTRLNYGDSLGNKREYEAGVMMNFGNWMIFPRYLHRDNLVGANPPVEPAIDDNGEILELGLEPRNRDDDPFAVLDNREARAAELFITYDPTGATGFYQWDNDFREDAKLAFNLAGNYTKLPTFTDSYQFFFVPTSTNASFGVNLPPEDTWELSSRIVYNPNQNIRSIFNIRHAFLQSTGDPEGGTRKFWEARAKFVIGKRHIIDAYFKKDAWGAYDFQRQFNVTFPEQYKLDYSILLDQKRDEKTSTKIGIRGLFRTNDENSPENEFIFNGEINRYRFHVVAYFIFNFGGTNPPRPIN